MIGEIISHYRILEKLGKDRIIFSNFHLKLISLFLFFIISSPYFYAQPIDLPFEHISIDQGMPTVVSDILQDRIGYLWFATNSGLYKYDGYNFISYKRDFANFNGVIDNTMTVLYEDKDGIIWIGSPFGIDKFDPKSETFTHFTPNPIDTIINKGNDVRAICEDNFGTLWIGTSYGLYTFDRIKVKFTHLLYDSTDYGSISSNNVGVIYKDKEGEIWVGTKAGLDRFNFKTRKFEHCYNDPNEKDEVWNESFSSYWINDIIEDEKGILWLGTNKGLVELNLKNGSISQLHIPNAYIHRIASISQDHLTGSLWLSTTEIMSSSGLFSFDKNSKKFTQYSSKGNCILSERSGTIWIGTNIGIQKLNRFKQPFKNYPMKNIVYSIKKGKEGVIWIFSLIPNIEWKQFDYKKEQFLTDSFVGDELLFVFNSGADLLFYSNSGIGYLVDTTGRKNIWYFSGKIINSANCLWKGSKGYWTGTDIGILLFKSFKIKHSVQIKNYNVSVHYIYEDSRGILWVATSMGKVYCYRQEGDSLVDLISITKSPITLHGRTVNQITENKKGRILFATTNGLEIYDRHTKSLNHFTDKDGLASNNVRGILEDEKGYLWINSNKGISKLDLDNKNFKNYDVSYGLKPTADVFYGKGCKISNGEMFFPSAMGFTRFHPDSVKDNPFIPPIVITSFKKFDKSHLIKKEIHLAYDENFLSFEFATLSYISPERNQYAYMMEGLDKDWVYSGTRRYASYTNLQPGEYVFRVKGSNNDGVWNEAGTSISIVISPPWWKTTWAYVFYSILFLSIVYATWKMQLKRIRMSHAYEMTKFEAEKLHEVDEMKSRFFTNISHEFRTPLTLILGPVEQMIEKLNEGKMKEDLSLVHRSANKLLELVNQLLDISKLESGNMKLQASLQNIIPFLKALVLSFTSYAERKRITLKFNSSEDEIIAYIDRDKIEKIIINVLSNAFKFTPEGGEVEVTVKGNMLSPPLEGRGVGQNNLTLNGFAEISIRDTGVGIPKEKLPKIFDRFYQVDGSHTREQEGTGIGLSLTKELVELHKGKIEVESEESKGTTFLISIPLGKAHLKPDEIFETVEESSTSFTADPVAFKEITDSTLDFDIITESEKPVLLIVEDNSDVRDYIKVNLNNEYRVLEAKDGEDGWNKSIGSTSGIPDLIISDVMMPKMDGFELCEKLKTDERTSHIPIILLTAKATTSDKIEGFELGADEYLMKPFNTNELRARIRNLIKQRKRLHEYFKNEGMADLSETKISSVNKKFLQKAFGIVTNNLSDTKFSVEAFAKNLCVSRSLLHKKMVALTGEPPSEFIKRVRLKKAAILIAENFGNLAEIALEVGFDNPAYFSECFKKQFGISPSHYKQKKQDS